MISNVLLSVLFFSSSVTACSDKAGLSVTSPTPLEALSGSCLNIPCSFEAKNHSPRENAVGIWIKTEARISTKFPQNVIFNSTWTTNAYSMTLMGNLKENNCSTLFSGLSPNHSNIYYFRIEDGKFKASAICDELRIIIRDSPWSPSINISVGDMKEHQSVTITCSALTPCPNSPPELTWNLQQDSHRQTEKNTDGTFTTKIQETITLSDSHDGYNISCSARYPVLGGNKTAETKVTLNVSYAPRNTSASISPSGLVSAGSWVELSCSSRAKPPPSFTWFRYSTEGAVNVSVGHFYSFNVTEGGEYHCVATNDLGNQTSSVMSLSLKGLPKKAELWLTAFTVIIGIICLAVFMLAITCCRRKATTDSTVSQLQIGNNKESKGNAKEDKEEEKEQTLHYGEIQFLKQTTEPSFDDRLEYDVVYSQVEVTEPESRLKHMVDGSDCLYAQVKKK